jgi:methylated-DNA-protein-cysteine methyltransferase related protein
MGSQYTRIYAIIQRIPKGKVATYGQIAHLAGLSNQARQVGYALSTLNDNKIPWQRVINAKGEVSARAIPGSENHQLLLLKKEGIRLNAKGQISLERYQWRPKHGDGPKGAI